MVLTELRWMASPAALQLARSAGIAALAADELALDWDNAWRVAEGLALVKSLVPKSHLSHAQASKSAKRH